MIVLVLLIDIICPTEVYVEFIHMKMKVAWFYYCLLSFWFVLIVITLVKFSTPDLQWPMCQKAIDYRTSVLGTTGGTMLNRPPGVEIWCVKVLSWNGKLYTRFWQRTEDQWGFLEWRCCLATAGPIATRLGSRVK